MTGHGSAGLETSMQDRNASNTDGKGGLGQSATTASLPERFIEAARRVSVAESDVLDFEPDDIIRIANDPGLRRDLRSLFRDRIQDPDTRHIILDYLADLLVEEEHDVATNRTLAEGLTRFVGSPAIAGAAAGVAALVSGVTFGSLALVSGGMVAMVAVGGAWTYIKLRSHVREKDIKKLKRLESDLTALDR